jgi:surface protein
MFYDATAFNQDVSDWNTGAVTTWLHVHFATAFNNGDPGNNGANPLDWADTSKVTDMSHMFYFATAFNQDVSDWNTGAVTNMVTCSTAPLPSTCVPRRHQREPAAVSINGRCRLRPLITDSRHSFNLHSLTFTKPQHYPANKHSVTQLLSNPIGPNTILKTMV